MLQRNDHEFEYSPPRGALERSCFTHTQALPAFGNTWASITVTDMAVYGV
jgi:hypothetical protein